MYKNLLILAIINIGLQQDPLSIRKTYCQSNLTYTPTAEQQSAYATIQNQVKALGTYPAFEGVMKNSDYTTYGTKIATGTAPWAVFFILSQQFQKRLLTYIIFWICCMCCCCCKTKFKAKPTITKLDIFCQFFLFIVVVAISIAGIVISQQIGPAITANECTMVQFFVTFTEGQDPLLPVPPTQTSVWIGTSGISTLANQILKDLNAMDTSLNTNFVAPSADNQQTKYNKQMTDCQDQATAIYTAAQNEGSVNEPNLGAANAKTIIMNNLGPSGTSNTFLNLYYSEIAIRKSAFDAVLNPIVIASTEVHNSVSSIQSSLASAVTTITNFTASAQSPLFSLTCLCGLPLLGEAITKFTRFTGLGRCIVKLSWVISGLLAIITLLIATVYCPLVLVTNDICVFINLNVSSQTYFNSMTGKYLSPDIQNYLGTCLFTTGDIATTLGIRSSIDSLGKLGNSFQAVSTLTDPSSPAYYLGTLTTALNNLKTFTSNSAQTLNTVIQAVVGVQTTFSTILNIVVGPKGIVSGTNCLFVAQLLKQFNSSFCQGFVPVNFFLMIFIIVIGVMMYFKMINEFRIDSVLRNQILFDQQLRTEQDPQLLLDIQMKQM